MNFNYRPNRRLRGMVLKNYELVVNDVFDELKAENERLLNELSFADKCLKLLTEIKAFIDLNSIDLKYNLMTTRLDIFEDLCRRIEEIFREKNSFVTEVKPEVCDQINRSDEQLESSAENISEVIPVKSVKKTTKKNGLKSVSLKRNYHKNGKSNDPKDSQWVCDFEGCGQRFKLEKKLKYHLWSHQKSGHRETDDLFRCPYPGCSFSSKIVYYVERHQFKHTNQRPYQCSQCDKSFKQESVLTSHVQRRHQLSEEPLICNIDNCQKQFQSEHSLKAHQNFYHTKEQKYVCDYPECQFKTPYEPLLAVHRVKHSEERPFVCPMDGCGRRFKFESGVKHHIDSHSDEPKYRCTHDDCAKAFRTRNSLRQHVESHSSVRLHCDWPGCDYTCNRKERLKGHCQSHTNGYTIACIWPNCDKMFKTKHTLSEHLKVHKGVKANVCNWPGCHYKCITAGNLRIHVKNVHKKL